MNSMIKALTVFTVALTPAAYARTAAPPASTAPATPPTSTSTYSSQSTVFHGGGSSMNPQVPGATGYSIVHGDNSTIAGDALATRMERTGAYGGE